ncbi:PH domain-containing protein [Streptomyces sp. N35]|uniref:PH domain-containing protein n=1 Tax=Streptomyces sp. N35 TaxID=2795730 RepID=UPI0018F41DAB|nr:PH domain-containing protein [Streptomyces sp. N35]
MSDLTGRPDIDRAAARLGMKFGSKREIKKLPELLWEGEQVDMLAAGQYGGGLGLLAMTNVRLIFLKHGFVSQQLEDFPYGKISSVQWKGGMLQGTLTVFTSGNKADITHIAKDDGKQMSDTLRARISGASLAGPSAHPAAPAQPWPQVVQTPAPVTPQPNAGNDVAARLQTLEQLYAQGIVSAEEYQQQRAAILASL